MHEGWVKFPKDCGEARIVQLQKEKKAWLKMLQTNPPPFYTKEDGETS